MTLKISWASSDGDPDDGDDDPDGEAPEDEEAGVPEVYTEEEMEAVEGHIQQYFGKFENVFHELSSPDIHVDICVCSALRGAGLLHPGNHGYGRPPDECPGGTGRIQAGAGGAGHRAAGELEAEA